MSFIALKNFASMRYGNVEAGDVVPVTGDIAKQMVDQGMVKISEEYALELRQKAQAEKLAKAKK